MKLTPYRQEHAYTCLPACLRIVLAYSGMKHTEAELAQACNTLPIWGTSPAEAVNGLQKMGYRALWFENASIERLFDLLAQNWPVIVFLRSADLPHGKAGLHAVVVSGMEDGKMLMIDPTIGDETRLPLKDFLSAWAALGNQGLVVWIP